MSYLNEVNITSVVSNERAAALINRRPQTLRKWACLDCAPAGIRPIRINGRLSWRISDLLMLLGGES
jgi:hypothetical protein